MTGATLRRSVSSAEPCVFSLARVRSHVGGLIHESPQAESRLLPAGSANEGDDAWLVLPNGGGLKTRDLLVPPAPGARTPSETIAYRAVDPQAPLPADEKKFVVDPAHLEGNTFRVLMESKRMAAAAFSVAPGRAVDVGPESERTWVVLSGSGLVFLQYEMTLPLDAGDVAIVPAGEPARIWSRGPGELRVIAMQPQAAPAKRRTLLGEVMRLRDKERRVSGAGF